MGDRQLPGQGVLPWNHRRCGDGGQVLAPALPNLVALVYEGGQILEILQVYHVADVGGHRAEEQDLLHLHHGGWLQGVELVHENRRFVCAQAGVIQFDNLLVFAEAVRALNNELKLLVRMYGSSTEPGSSQSGPMVSTSVAGSLESALWNFVMGLVTRLTAKVALMLQNQAMGASA